MKFFTKSVVLGLTCVLFACGTPQAGGGNAFIVVGDDGQTISGQYDSADFSTGQMKTLLTGLCKSPRLATYGEQASGALVAFSTTCSGGTYGTPGAGGSFRKTSADRVQMNFTYRDLARDVLVQAVSQFQLTATGARQLNRENISL